MNNLIKLFKNNAKLYIILGIIILLGTIGITYSLVIGEFRAISINSTTLDIDANITYDTNSNGAEIISNGNMLPISDDLISSTVTDTRVLKATFNVTGESNNPRNTIYDIALHDINIDCDLRTKDLKWKLYKNDSFLSEGNLSPTFDTMAGNRLVLTNEQEELTTNTDKYTFVLWISESCSGDVEDCDPSLDQSKYLNKTLSASIRVELSTKSKKKLTRITGSEDSCTYTPIDVPVCNNITYSGSTQELVADGSNYTLINNSGTNAGTYSVTVKLNDGYKWTNGSTDNKVMNCKVNRKNITITTLDQTILYGKIISNSIENVSVETLVSGHKLDSVTLNSSIVDVGQGIISTNSAKILDANNNDVTYNYNINKNNIGKITINCLNIAEEPIASDKVYNGETQIGVDGGSYIELKGASSAENIGTYKVIATPQKNYCWDDKTTSEKEYTWNINTGNAAIDLETETLELTYNDYRELTYVYIGDGELSCSTSNSDVATCSVDKTNKKITVKSTGIGTTNITVSATAGKNYGATSAVIPVTVNKGNITDMTIALTPDKYEWDGTEKTPKVIIQNNNGTLTGAQNKFKLLKIGAYATYDDFKLTFDSSAVNTSGQNIKILKYTGTTYVSSIYTTTLAGEHKTTFVKDSSFDRIRFGMNGNKADADIYLDCSSLEDGKSYTLSFFIETYRTFYAEITNILIYETESNADYLVTYEDNLNVGTGKVLVSGINNYEGSVTKTFEIVDTVAPTVESYAGKLLYTDPEFASGVNSTTVYNNSSNGNLTITRKTISGIPNSSGYGLEIVVNGTVSPYYGGFALVTPTAANQLYIVRIIAKIPKGFNINLGSNSTGSNPVRRWITSQAGTGDWEEYVLYNKCSSAGTFSTTNYFYLTADSTTSVSYPITWQVANATVIETTNDVKNYIISVGTDNQSGISHYAYTTTDAVPTNWTSSTIGSATYATSILASPTPQTHYAWFKDYSGNVSNSSVTIVPPGPTITIQNSSGGSWSNTDITLVVNYIDGGGGIDPTTISYSEDGTNYTSYNLSSVPTNHTTTWSTEGERTVYIKACDNIGQCTVVSTPVKIDKTAPTISVSNPSGSSWTNNDINCVLTYSDTGSSEINPASLAYNPDGTYRTFTSNTNASTYTHTWKLADWPGERTAYYKICDNAGNCKTTSTVIRLGVYTVTYNANGGSGAPSSQTKYHGKTLTLSETTPTRTNYAFLGWSTSSTATSATYSAEGSFTTNANTTLYAVWESTYIDTWQTGKTGSYQLTANSVARPYCTMTLEVNWSESYNESKNSSKVSITALKAASGCTGDIEYFGGNEQSESAITHGMYINGVLITKMSHYLGGFYLRTGETLQTINSKVAFPWTSGEIAHASDGTASTTIRTYLSGVGLNYGNVYNFDNTTTITLTDLR